MNIHAILRALLAKQSRQQWRTCLACHASMAEPAPAACTLLCAHAGDPELHLVCVEGPMLPSEHGSCLKTCHLKPAAAGTQHTHIVCPAHPLLHTLSCTMRAGLASPQLKSATGPVSAHRDSCLVLPNSPMAPTPPSQATWQTQSVPPKTPLSRAGTAGAALVSADKSSSSTLEPAAQSPQEQPKQQAPQPVARQAVADEYNYIK